MKSYGSHSAPLQKNFIADLDALEHAKKKVVKMSKFWDDNIDIAEDTCDIGLNCSSRSV